MSKLRNSWYQKTLVRVKMQTGPQKKISEIYISKKGTEFRIYNYYMTLNKEKNTNMQVVWRDISQMKRWPIHMCKYLFIILGDAN